MSPRKGDQELNTIIVPETTNSGESLKSKTLSSQKKFTKFHLYKNVDLSDGKVQNKREQYQLISSKVGVNPVPIAQTGSYAKIICSHEDALKERTTFFN